jgi:hypothetical protein
MGNLCMYAVTPNTYTHTHRKFNKEIYTQLLRTQRTSTTRKFLMRIGSNNLSLQKSCQKLNKSFDKNTFFSFLVSIIAEMHNENVLYLNSPA